MPESSDRDIAALAASVRRGSVVAAAGCGKTEQIALATQTADGRRLLLTHTHAGVDALRARLRKHKVPSDKFRVETIAGWCLRYAASFPKHSGLSFTTPRVDRDWNIVYEAAVRLIGSGAIDSVLECSYSGVFVDEYQDCTTLQHHVITALSAHLRVCVFGDPLQAIFDFKGQQPVDWSVDVYPVFAKVGELTTPWRWRNAGNSALADWLAELRSTLQAGAGIDLTHRPECVRWERLPGEPESRHGKIVGTCKSVMGKCADGQLVVIGDAANLNGRAALARKLAAVGFSNIEPLACKNLYAAGTTIGTETGFARLEKSLDFICACMTGSDRSAFTKAVRSHQAGGRLGAARFDDLIKIGIAVVDGTTDDAVLDLLEGFHRWPPTRLFRREMFFAMRSALRLKITRGSDSLVDAIWEVQNRIRHTGRMGWRLSVGSTLLVKGLEFDYSVIIHAENMTKKDWYVALTRATREVMILSPSERIIPAA